MNSCEKIDSLIEEYLDGALSDEENKQFLEHISSCEKCRTALDVAKKMHEALKGLDYCLEVPEDFAKTLHKKIEKAPKRKSLITYTSRMGAVAACVVLVAVVAKSGIDTRLVKNADELEAEDSAGVVITEIAKKDIEEAMFTEEQNTTEATEDKDKSQIEDNNVQRKMTAKDADVKNTADKKASEYTNTVKPKEAGASGAVQNIIIQEPLKEIQKNKTEKEALPDTDKTEKVSEETATAAFETADVPVVNDTAVTGITEPAEEDAIEQTQKADEAEEIPEETPAKKMSSGGGSAGGGGGSSSSAVRRMAVYELKAGIDDIERAAAIAEKFAAPQNGVYTINSETVQKLLSELEKAGIEASFSGTLEGDEISFAITAR